MVFKLIFNNNKKDVLTPVSSSLANIIHLQVILTHFRIVYLLFVVSMLICFSLVVYVLFEVLTSYVAIDID